MDEQEFLLMLQKYADVIVKIGLNLQPGQRLIIDTDICDAQLARQVAKSAYKAEAKFVDVLYRDSYLERATVEYAPVDGLGEGFAWRANALLEYLDKGDAFLIIDATDPDLMQGLSPERISHFQHAYRENLKQVWVHWRKLSINRCIVAGTNIDWAIKVLPDIPKDEAKDRIWETIFRLCRIDQDDPVAAWQEHMADLTARCNHMNAKRYRHLEYRAAGTNLKVGLPMNHIWSCGRIKSQNGIENTPNIPTEEIWEWLKTG